MKKGLEYFENWQLEKDNNQHQFGLNGTEVAKMYIAKETYNNMKQCVCGFINYCEYLFLNEKIYTEFMHHTAIKAV